MAACGIDDIIEETIMSKENELYKAMEACNQGLTLSENGDYTKALDAFSDALVIFEAEKDHKNEAQVLMNIGSVYRDMSEPILAEEYYHHAMEIFERLDDQEGIANQFSNLGYISYVTSRLEEAAAYFEKAARLYTKTGNTERARLAEQNVEALKKELMS